MVNIAVILSGCGVLDGSEIHESVLTLRAIKALGYDYQCLAPSDSFASSNHVTQACNDYARNALEESARIARGHIMAIADAEPDDFVASVFPGGFGVAKNLSNFAEKGSECTMHADTLSFAKAMASAQKPQGFLCIAPVLMPIIYGSDVQLTIGKDPETIRALQAMGAVHHEANVDDVIVDDKHKAVSSPAYMLAASILEVDQSVQALMQALDKLIRDEAFSR